jgi:hypothetical protein
MSARLSVVFAGISLAIASSFWGGTAHAKDLYRWVDEKGTTHIADTVPPEYKKSAKRIDTRASQVSESDRAQAIARAAREKAAADGAGAANTPSKVDLTAEKQPATSGTDQNASCDQLRRAYAASQGCFAPYRAANGAVKAEAYQRCTEVPDPSPRCGIPSNSHVDD